ncbi:hypothetical protein [uncultured Legionella sp.]|uniref:hypothetical protein n=1 Tax=uncultured Legionella sp. TaxID=210934 RepID=UPI002630EB20|nr:hypothetical protein [uncultured Legionella sp.]
MTQYYQDLLTKLKNKPAPKQEHHLFLLGTGVNFVNRPTDPSIMTSYVRGETFSYTAQLMTHVLGEKATIAADADNLKSPSYAHPYHSDSVDVVNGADIPGYEIGDRLAKALMLALGAIAEGKTNLSISGFSRGGAQAIVLTHELERIRAALAQDLQKDLSQRKTLATIISESDSVKSNIYPYTSQTLTELNKLIPDKGANENDETLKEALLDNLNKLQVNLFVLDPVPGGNIAKIIRVGWQEEALYTLPSFVAKKHELVQKHETSRGFKPIIPLGMPYEVIPGCHGTGDGNQYDHNGSPVPDTLKTKDLSGVQDLVLRQWIDFTFPDGLALEQEINFEHPALDAVVNACLPADRAERNRQLLDNYKHIMENYPAFEWLATRNYTGLGQYMAERQVHFRQRGNTPITNLEVHGDGENFLNLQHVKLWMTYQLDGADFFGKSLTEQVEWLKNNIETAFSTENLSKSVAPGSYMIKQLLQKEGNHPLVKESLSYLVNTVAQVYLRNHLSQEERAQCRSCVENTFKTLADATFGTLIKDPTLIELAKSLTVSVQSDLTGTVIMHQNSLLSLANKLSADEKMVLANFDKQTDDQDATADSPMSWLVNAQKLVGDLDLLKEQIEVLQPWCDQEMLTTNWKGMLPKFGISPEDVSYEAYKGRLFQYIQQQQMLLVVGASKIMAKMPEVLETKPQEMERHFYDYVYRYASIDTTNHQLRATTKQLDAKEEQLSSTTDELKKAMVLNNLLKKQLLKSADSLIRLKAEIKTQTEHNQSLTQRLEEKETALKEALQQVSDVTSSNKGMKKQVSALSEALSELKGELSIKIAELQSASESAERLTKKISELEHMLQDSESTAVAKEERISALQSEIETLKSQSASIAEELKNEKATLLKADNTIAELSDTVKVSKEALKAAQDEIAQLKEALALKNTDTTNQVLQKQVQAYQSARERAAIVKIDSLMAITTKYLIHLIETDDQSALTEAKLASAYELLGHLNNTELLPSEQLAAFDNTLNSTQDTIKEHRDPMWMRFFRDCARILTVALSGVGLYRVATGQSPHFFQPSKGEDFIEEVQNINSPSANK